MSVTHLRWAGSLERSLPLGPFTALRRMAYTVNEEGLYWGSLDRLESRGMAERSVRDHLRYLERRGVVERLGRADHDRRSVCYRLVLGARPTPETSEEIAERERLKRRRIERTQQRLQHVLAGVPVFVELCSVPAESAPAVQAESCESTGEIEPEYRQTTPASPRSHYNLNNKTDSENEKEKERDNFRTLYNRIRLGRVTEKDWQAAEEASGGTVRPIVTILRRQIERGIIRPGTYTHGPGTYLQNRLWLGYEEGQKPSGQGSIATSEDSTFQLGQRRLNDLEARKIAAFEKLVAEDGIEEAWDRMRSTLNAPHLAGVLRLVQERWQETRPDRHRKVA